MSKAWRRRGWLAGVGGALVAGAKFEKDDGPAAVRKLLEKQVADWNRLDLDGFLATYWHSPKLVFQSGGERSDGWDATRDRYRKRYQGAGKEMGRLEFLNLEVESLGPESAFARGRWRLTLKDGSKPGGLFTLIVRRLGEGWRIVHDHTSSDQ